MCVFLCFCPVLLILCPFLALNCPFLENRIAVIMFYNRPLQLQLISAFINLKEKSSTDKMGDYPKIWLQFVFRDLSKRKFSSFLVQDFSMFTEALLFIVCLVILKPCKYKCKKYFLCTVLCSDMFKVRITCIKLLSCMCQKLVIKTVEWRQWTWLNCLFCWFWTFF